MDHQIRMMAKIAIITILFMEINATPSCKLLGQRNDSLSCDSDGADYKLKEGLVSSQNEIKSLNLTDCRITEIECDAFAGLPMLKHLNLAENKLRELKPCTMKLLPQLVSLNASHNQISALTSGTFDHLINLEELHLKGNVLTIIPPEFFDKLTKLSTLDLSNNFLDDKSFSSRLFYHNKVIIYLDLSRNDLSTAPDNLLQPLQTLHYLFLSRCFLTSVPKFATNANMKTLRELILSTNQISNLDDPKIFTNLDELLILNFAGNTIESIAENIFTPLRKLKTIVLKHNHLKQIPERLFQNMPKLVNIDLSYNDIEVVDFSSFRYTPMKNLNLSGNKLSHLPLNFFDTLTSSGGKLKKFLFTNNPWQCACLRDILEEVKNHNIEYNSTIYDGQVSVCLGDYFTCHRG